MTKKDMIIAIKDEVGNSADDVVERAKFLKSISQSDGEFQNRKDNDPILHDLIAKFIGIKRLAEKLGIE